jgi:hypothetical protein
MADTNSGAKGDEPVPITDSTAKREAYVVARRRFLTLKEECMRQFRILDAAAERLKTPKAYPALRNLPDPLRNLQKAAPSEPSAPNPLPSIEEINNLIAERLEAARQVVIAWKTLTKDEQSDSPEFPDELRSATY